MRAQGIAKLSLLLVFHLLIGHLAAPASGQSPRPMPDPFAGQTGTYQTDPALPVQAELRDCHLFEAISWGWGTDSLRSRMRMSCQYLARMGPGGSDRDRATAHALLAFEAEARAHLARLDQAFGEADPDGSPMRSGSLILRTGWWADHPSQDRIITGLRLDLIMGAPLEDG